jgi:hypothetical protein
MAEAIDLSSETTPLLSSQPTTTTSTINNQPVKKNKTSHLYFQWEANYWFAIFGIFMAGCIAGSNVAVNVPFLKELFCERGIPTLFPGSDQTSPENYTNPLIDSSSMNEERDCDSAEYSAAISKFVGISMSLAAASSKSFLSY